MGRHDHANPCCASVRMRFLISVPSCAHAHSSVCACVFTSPNHTSWFACRQGPSLCFQSLEERLLSKLLCCLFVDSWSLNFSACQICCPDLLNLITRWLWFCLRLNQEFLIGVRQELCMKELWKSWSEIGKTVEKCKWPSLSVLVEKTHAVVTIET